MSSTTIPGFALERPHRADARRNFDALLASARAAFAARGADVPLEEIARDAGVGIGTLYRNFPTRQHLFEAVYVAEVEELIRAAGETTGLPPWEAWVGWLERFAGYVMTKRAVLEEIGTDSELFRGCKLALVSAGEPLFRAGQDAGEIRPDAAFDDVLRMVAGVIASPCADAAQRDRVLGLALDGIRPRGER
ncbi:MAG: Transcriptional regulator, AcrR family [uncultured Solirubrobacteraceae bacterium]|uniref:Transcriptional regulator, AcrR family n=1 Tax=uncultured Solirubrobacteraceae bacterium TaxID=1162706 RepID=A0A6J4T703_9ACTN|nr:MAG: Transcriptional regulator, AcrR family [uncultured Solirubrobacteraceae bacterium]